MVNYLRIAQPGRWLAQLIALRTQLPRHGEPTVYSHPSRDQDQEHETHPTTMQTIERASAFYQEKLGFNTLFFFGEFRRMC